MAYYAHLETRDFNLSAGFSMMCHDNPAKRINRGVEIAITPKGPKPGMRNKTAWMIG